MLKKKDIYGASILIVDDQESDVILLEQMLKMDGYTEVTSTRQPEKVLTLHKKNKYDLILLDLLMPGMDGFQILQGLKEIEKDSYVSVLVITAYSDHKSKALEAGAKDFISKPFDMVEIKTRIYNMLEVRLLYKAAEKHNRALERQAERRTEELQAANAQLKKDKDFQEQLVNDLSHQLRTPLTSMRGAIEIALNTARVHEEYQSVLESTIAEIDRISMLINTMLSFVKLENHTENLHYTRFSLLKLFEETIAELNPLWEEKSIKFEYRFFRKKESYEELPLNSTNSEQEDQTLPDLFTITADEFRLKQTFINILDNAYKYSPNSGKIKVELFRETGKNVQNCRIVISNEGESIPESSLPHLFTPFYQGENTMRNDVKGFGLGLSICRRIVEMHKGKIRAFNPESGGAAFEIILPLEPIAKVPLV